MSEGSAPEPMESPAEPQNLFYRLPDELQIRIIRKFQPNRSKVDRAALATCLRVFRSLTIKIKARLYEKLSIGDFYTNSEEVRLEDRLLPTLTSNLHSCRLLYVPTYQSGFDRAHWDFAKLDSLELLFLTSDIHGNRDTDGQWPQWSCGIHMSRTQDSCPICSLLRQARTRTLVREPGHIIRISFEHYLSDGELASPTLGTYIPEPFKLQNSLQTLIILPTYQAQWPGEECQPIPDFLQHIDEVVILLLPGRFVTDYDPTLGFRRGDREDYHTSSGDEPPWPWPWSRSQLFEIRRINLVTDLLNLISSPTKPTTDIKRPKITIVGLERFAHVYDENLEGKTGMQIRAEIEKEVREAAHMETFPHGSAQAFKATFKETRFISLEEYAKTLKGFDRNILGDDVWKLLEEEAAQVEDLKSEDKLETGAAEE